VAVLIQKSRRIVCPSRRRFGVERHGECLSKREARRQRDLAGRSEGEGREEGMPCGRLRVSLKLLENANKENE
jgi:hypothetical protein